MSSRSYMPRVCFVIGAGAHAQLGCPTGKQLREMILNLASTPDELAQGLFFRHVGTPCRPDNVQARAFELLFTGLGETEWFHHVLRELDAFKIALKDDASASIDGFAAHHQKYRHLLKFLTSRLLWGTGLAGWGYSKPSSWLDILGAMVDLSAEDERANSICRNPAVITFNYDRNLELFLARRHFDASFRHGLNRQSAPRGSYFNRKGGPEEGMIVQTAVDAAVASFEIVQELLPILHIHGDLGEIRFISGPNNDVVPISGQGNLNSLVMSSTRLRMIGDSRSESQDVRNVAQYLVARARLVVFLGFAFDERNLEILGIDATKPRSAKLIGTAWHTTDDERSRIQNQIGDIDLAELNADTFMVSKQSLIQSYIDGKTK